MEAPKNYLGASQRLMEVLYKLMLVSTLELFEQ
jgi:hypothetical protein